MKQIIPFVKDIKLEPKIFDITSISLEHDLKLENNDSIVGEFNISGKYKINSVSISEEAFDENIEFDITLDDKYDAKKVQIDIDDFYYEIINEEFLRIHIDVLVDNLVYLKKQEIKEKKELLDNKEENKTVKPESIIEEKEEVISAIEDEFKHLFEKNEERKENVMEKEVIVKEEKKEDEMQSINLTTNFLTDEEQYSTYKVHIVRENETVETIIEKYNVSKDELKKYNDLENILIGTKIIIPTYDIQ